MDAPTITEFYATWCVPCKTQDVELKRLEALKPGIRIVKLDIAEHPEMVQKYMIQTVPFVMCEQPGKPPMGLPGLSTAEQIITKFGL